MCDGPEHLSETIEIPADTVSDLFQGCSGPILLPGDGLAEGLASCLKGWPRGRGMGDRPPLAAVASVGNTPARYTVVSQYAEDPTPDLAAASAVCALIADLTQDWSETNTDVIGFHGGAVEVAGKAVLFAGPARAGKTTLISRYALEPGVVFYADDVVPVNRHGQAIALGVAPRLRLPIPSVRLKRYTKLKKILGDRRYVYFSPPNQASYGDFAALGGLILIDRQEGAEAALYRLSHEDAIATLLQQSISSFLDADDAMRRVEELLKNLPTARLVYSDLEEAVSVLNRDLRAFFDEQLDLPDCALPVPNRLRADEAAALPSDETVRKSDEAILRRLGARSWLWLPEDGMIWELNPVSAAIWELLEIPGSAEDLAEVLAEVFSDQPIDRLTLDVALALGQMASAGLVLRSDAE